MVHRIEVVSKILDAREQIKKRHLEESGFSGKVDSVHISDVYTIDADFTPEQLERISSMLSNKVFQKVAVGKTNTRAF